MLFEMKEPSVFLLNDKQMELFKELLVCFCKPEKFRSLIGKGLLSLKLTADIMVKKNELFIGGRNLPLISNEKNLHSVNEN